MLGPQRATERASELLYCFAPTGQAFSALALRCLLLTKSPSSCKTGPPC